jgi:glycosyltransferase involved in cell wall biosynthesis
VSDGAASPYRVMMLTDSLDVGGLERVVVSLARGLHERGHAVTVVAEAGGALWDDLPEEVDRWTAPPRETAVQKWRYFWWLARRIRSGNFDVVHAHQRGVALQARLARMFSSVRVVEHVHNVFVPTAGAWLSFRGDRLIACGAAVADMLMTDFRRSPSRITIVPNAVRDLALEEESLELPASRRNGIPGLLVLARTSEQKDPRRFIDVIEQLNGARKRVEAVWVGEGELLHQCRAEVQRRGVEGLAFVGGSADVVPFLRQADLVMLTSRWEGLPLALLEGAAMGRALMAPSVGSCAEVVDHGRNGLLFDVDSEPAAIAELVEQLLDRETLRSMGEASRRKYLSQFGLRGQIDRVEEVYRRALAS